MIGNRGIVERGKPYVPVSWKKAVSWGITERSSRRDLDAIDALEIICTQ